MTGTEIVAKESRNNEERRVNSETKLKIAVNEEVDQRKGILAATLEKITVFVAIIVPVRMITVAPVGQLTTRGLFWSWAGTAIRIKHDFGAVQGND